jgi:predicted HicB family RNase H-like nuclease
MSDFKADKVMSYGEFQGTAEVSLEDNCLFGRILHIDDVITYEADSPQQLKLAFEEAVNDYLDYCKTNGSSPNKPYKGVFNVRVNPALHKQLALLARKRGVALNEVVKEALAEKVSADIRGPNAVVHKHEYHIHAGETDSYDVSDDAEGGSQWLKNLDPQRPRIIQ